MGAIWGCHRGHIGFYGLKSCLIVVPYILAYLTPFKEFLTVAHVYSKQILNPNP